MLASRRAGCGLEVTGGLSVTSIGAVVSFACPLFKRRGRWKDWWKLPGGRKRRHSALFLRYLPPSTSSTEKRQVNKGASVMNASTCTWWREQEARGSRWKMEDEHRNCGLQSHTGGFHLSFHHLPPSVFSGRCRHLLVRESHGMFAAQMSWPPASGSIERWRPPGRQRIVGDNARSGMGNCIRGYPAVNREATGLHRRPGRPAEHIPRGIQQNRPGGAACGQRWALRWGQLRDSV